LSKRPSRRRKEASHAAIEPIRPIGAGVLAFLERRPVAIAAVLIALACVRIAATYTRLGVTYDEPAHLAAGTEYLSEHVYRYETQHPPLARVMDALGPYIAGTRKTGGPNMFEEGAAEIYRGGHPALTIALARLGALPFFVLACVVVYLLARGLLGRAGAAAATGLFTLIPTVLAHAGLATTDMALTACLGAAFYALTVWARRPTPKHSLIFGLATAAAVVSKFTSLGYFPAAAALALVFWAATERPGLGGAVSRARALAMPFAIAVLAGAAAIWAVYRFSFGPVPGWGISLPAPELFDGIRSALRHYERGNLGFFMGRTGSSGWWYFFPVLIAVKTPIAFLALLGFGCYACWKARLARIWCLPLALSLGVLISGMTSRVNLGLRHVLPVYIGFSVLAAFGLLELLRGGRWKAAGPAAALALVAWLAISGAAAEPNYLAYFNAFAGSEPENIAVDSDLDWGQDTKALADRLRELGVREVGFTTMNFSPEQLAEWPGMPAIHPIDPLIPTEGWTAVSPTFWKVGQYGLDHKYPNIKLWFERLKPVERVGALRLYYIPEGSLRRER
jgi:4-amino-4-deoxy-L-arabinose transferase-like glycosyltransferase